jgi:TGF-beta propeptide
LTVNLAKKDHFINTIGGIYFDLDKRIDSNVKLDKAVLRLFIRRRRLANETSMSSNDTTATLTIGVIKAPDTNRSTHQSQELTPSIYPFNIRPESAATSLLNSSGFWVSLDVKKLVHRWITDEKENHGIRLEARLPNDLDGYNYAVTPQNLEKNEEDLVGFSAAYFKHKNARLSQLKKIFFHIDCLT